MNISIEKPVNTPIGQVECPLCGQIFISTHPGAAWYESNGKMVRICDLCASLA